MAGADLARIVTCEKPYQWLREGGRWVRKNIEQAPELAAGERFRVVVMDFGVKFNTLRSLVGRGCQVLVVPAARLPQRRFWISSRMGLWCPTAPGIPLP